jgi:hypothetical protein
VAEFRFGFSIIFYLRLVILLIIDKSYEGGSFFRQIEVKRAISEHLDGRCSPRDRFRDRFEVEPNRSTGARQCAGYGN